MVYLLPTEQQQELTDRVADFLRNEFPLSRFRNGPTADDRSRWERLVEYGLIGLGAPETAGGTGFALTDEVLIFRETGRVLLSPSVLASAMASRVAAAEGRVDLARDLISGSRSACLAIPREPDYAAAGYYLLDGTGADFILVASRSRLRLFMFPSDGVERAESLDDSVSLGRLAELPGEPLAVGDDHAVSEFTLLCAAQLTGISEQARDLAVAYAKTREQFGRPIGSFQAIKHRCADMAVRSEIAVAQLYRGAVTNRDRAADAAFHACAAFVLANRAAQENTAAAIQIHGGIGFTAECDVHWLLKRAQLLAALNISPLTEPAMFLGVGQLPAPAQAATDG